MYVFHIFYETDNYAAKILHQLNVQPFFKLKNSLKHAKLYFSFISKRHHALKDNVKHEGKHFKAPFGLREWKGKQQRGIGGIWLLFFGLIFVEGKERIGREREGEVQRRRERGEKKGRRKGGVSEGGGRKREGREEGK